MPFLAVDRNDAFGGFPRQPPDFAQPQADGAIWVHTAVPVAGRDIRRQDDDAVQGCEHRHQIGARRGYGAFAGDLALHWLARGGVYLAGGIAAKLLPKTDAGPFVGAFLAKREHAHLAQEMPLRLITDESLGLRGTLALAAT